MRDRFFKVNIRYILKKKILNNVVKFMVVREKEEEKKTG